MPDHPFLRTPELDDDGLLRRDGRWVAVPDAQLGVVALLLARFGRVVPVDVVAAAYAASGRTTSATAVRSLLGRVNRTVRPLDLRLRTVRGRGVMLEEHESVR